MLPNSPVQHVLHCPSSQVQHVICCPNSPVQHVLHCPNSPVQHVLHCPNSPVRHVLHCPNSPVRHVRHCTRHQRCCHRLRDWVHARSRWESCRTAARRNNTGRCCWTVPHYTHPSVAVVWNRKLAFRHMQKTSSTHHGDRWHCDKLVISGNRFYFCNRVYMQSFTATKLFSKFSKNMLL